MALRDDGNVGIRTSLLVSALHVFGYTQLDLTTRAPTSADCDDVAGFRRMKVDLFNICLFICMNAGWVSKYPQFVWEQGGLPPPNQISWSPFFLKEKGSE